MPSACHAHTGRPLAGAHGPYIRKGVACTRRSTINLGLHGGLPTALWAPAAPAGPCSVAAACITARPSHAGPSAPYAGRPAACLYVRSITKHALRTRHGTACSAHRVTCTWHHIFPVIIKILGQGCCMAGYTLHYAMAPCHKSSWAGLCGFKVRRRIEPLERANEHETSGSKHAGRVKPWRRVMRVL